MDVNILDHLIRADVIAPAQARLDRVVAHRGPAQAALAAATADHATVRKAAHLSLSGGNDLDPHMAASAEEAAAKRVQVCEAAIPAIEAAIVRAEADLRQATAKAKAPVLAAGIQERLASARRADAARAELAAAEADYKSATAIIKNAGGGYHDIDQSSPSLTLHDGIFKQPTYAEDLRRFSEPHGHFPGLNADGSVKSVA